MGKMSKGKDDLMYANAHESSMRDCLIIENNLSILANYAGEHKTGGKKTGEIIANLTLARRHIEDARGRILRAFANSDIGRGMPDEVAKMIVNAWN